MILWNKGLDHIDNGHYETKHCPNCNRTHDFNLILQYKYEGIWWFSRIYEIEYLALCGACKKGHKIAAKEINKTFKLAPIPFMRNYGFITLISISGVAGVITALSK